MPEIWRLLDTGVQNAAYNMALEKVLLASSAEGNAVNTLHLLEFFPCVLLGYNQTVRAEVEEDFCCQNGIEINRRVSGGGCIYTDGGTLGWEIIAKKVAPGIPKNLEEMYRKLCGGIVRMLSAYGINASYRPLNDVEVEGRKISGTGGAELEDSFIFHGTLLVDFDAETMVKALKIPVKKLEDKRISDFKTRTVCMRELLGTPLFINDVKARLAQAFAETLDVCFKQGGLSAFETELLSKELPLFSSDGWIYGRDVPLRESGLCVYEHKAAGGLIRVSLLMDGKRNYIKSAFVTGDFFAYPQRSILQLESVLKNIPAKPELISKKITDFFTNPNIKIPGADATDFITAVTKAAETKESE